MRIKTALLGCLAKAASKAHLHRQRISRLCDLHKVSLRDSIIFSLNLILLSLLYIFSASASFANQTSIKAIYGIDDRMDPDDSNNPEAIEWYKSTAAMIETSKLQKLSNGSYKIVAKKHGEELLWASGRTAKLCPDERFVNQPQASVCSGFLVSPNLLVTAGHCIKNQSDCDSYKWVFDYKAHPDTGVVDDLNADSVYSCKKIVDRKLVSGENSNDYALIELSQKVVNRKPAKFRRKTGLTEGTKLVLIGYPSGLPAKISAGAEVKKVNGTYFEANVDAFGGNSGSAVFNEDSGEVEGILVRGRTDYIFDHESQCARPAKFSNTDTSYEASTLITNIEKLLEIEDEVEPPKPPTPEPPVPAPPKPPRRVKRCFLWFCWYV